MPFVVDASVAANWLLPGEEPEALEAWRRITDDPALVPQHWWFEVRNVLLTAERRQRISPNSTTAILDRLARIRITFVAQPNDGSVFVLARRHHLTFYDGAYLELAMREQIALATLDLALAAAAEREGVALVLAT
jgi:predicted nucleic acid-binding protein